MAGSVRVVEYAVFVGVAAVLTLGVAAAGRGLFGEAEAVGAWRWGCGVSFAASAVAGLVVVTGSSSRAASFALGVMLVRLAALVVAAGGVAVVQSLQPRPFLLAIAASYVPLLVIDTAYALRAAKRL